MADKKISALTSAATPLAGTEVLPIVQSGSTVKVSVGDLTTGRTVALRNANLTGGAAVINIGATGDNSYHYLRTIDNDGQAIYIGNDSATGSFFGAGAYGRVIYSEGAKPLKVFVNGAYRAEYDTSGNYKLDTGNLVIGTAGKGITNSTGSVALNFSTVGTALTGGTQSVLTGSFNNVGTAQTVTPDDTRGGYIVITAIQPGIGSTTYTLPFVKRGGVAAVGTASKAILTADPITSVTASGGGIVITPVAANTYITYAIYYTPLGI